MQNVKSSVETISSVQKKLVITVCSKAVNSSFESTYQKLKKNANIKGFRPGKVPNYIIKKLYGDQASHEVGENLIKDNVFEAIKDHNIAAISRPMIESQASPKIDCDYVFSATVDIMPTIDLADKYKDIECEHIQYTYSNEDVDKELGKLARKHAQLSPIAEEAVAEKNHCVQVSYSALLEGKPLPELSAKETHVWLGHNEIDEFIEPLIMGMKKDESKELDVVVPETFVAESLRNKSVRLMISLKDIQNIKLPDLNDDFAKDLEFESLGALKEKINKSFKEKVENANKQTKEAAILTAILEKVKFEVPLCVTDQVIDSLIKNFNVPGQSSSKSEELLHNKELRKQLFPEGENRARTSMLLWEIIKLEKVEVNDEAVKEEIKKYLPENSTDSAKQEELEKMFQSMGERVRENLLFSKALEAVFTYTKFTATQKSITSTK
tara:strand:+ start:1861 stop:3177 length:1317 start_codon:yes stop_codon:yes gene_type:complete